METISSRARRALAEGGTPRLLKKALFAGARAVKAAFLNIYYKLVPASKFNFKGQSYRYFRHAYNNAANNERTVEVPLVWREVQSSSGSSILEVGNVLANYYRTRHDVLDKYEPGPGIINEDALTWKPARPYDLIVSISTMEHVGWDETPRTPEKIKQAFRNLIDNCLAPGGRLIFTIPLGYNSYLDASLEDGSLKFTEQFFMKRISLANDWKEADWEEVRGSAYGRPFPNANAILFGVARKA